MDWLEKIINPKKRMTLEERAEAIKAKEEYLKQLEVEASIADKERELERRIEKAKNKIRPPKDWGSY